MKKVLSLNFIIVLIILVCSFSCVLVGSFAKSDVSYANIKNDNIVYDSVDKVIKINENKTMEITETIDLTFEKSGINVGLSRNVSRANKITRFVNGKEYVTKTINKLSDVTVEFDGEKEYFFIETSNDYFYINTGADFDFKEAGQHTYVIKYTYDMGHDFIDDFDDFTFDIMDYGFKSTVKSFSATIILPNDFTDGKQLSDILTFRTNNMSALSYEAVNLQVEGNVLKCSFGTLKAGNGLTMQLLLPEGYFNTHFSPSGFYILILVLSIICFLAILIIVIINLTKQKVVVTPEFYPPKDYNALEVARLYRGKVISKDFASLIIEWAAKGYVSIKMKSKKNVLIKKLKDMPQPEFEQEKLRKEKYYFDALFEDGDIYDTSDYMNKYNSSVRIAVSELYKNGSSKTKKKVLLRLGIGVLALLPLLFYLIWFNITIQSAFHFFLMLLFPVIAINIFAYVPMPLWFKIIWCGGFGGIPLGFLFASCDYSCDIFHLIYICIAILIIGTLMGFFIKIFTKEEVKTRGKIIGFKQFLVTCELDKLEMMIAEDPEYYYNILPYCYVFGITKKMEAKFKALHVEEPSYCQGVSVAVFCSALNHSVHGMGVSSSSGGGSGGGGGGSSGGGGGGGGCGGR